MTDRAARRDLSDNDLTQAVLDSFATSGDARFREIARSLARHLHAFAAEVQLTEEEWFAGIGFLTRTGHITDDKRQEFVLLSDVLGLSMQVIGINHRHPGGATESTVFGPFFVEGSPAFENGEDIAAGAPGPPCFVQGRVLSTDGAPIAGALVEIWQADEDGLYDVQISGLGAPRARGHLRSASDGRFWFWSILPEPYPIPYDGPVGDLLRAAGRSPWRPAHVHFKIEAPGYAPLITHVFVAGDRYLDTDAVFGVKSSLIAPFHRHEAGEPTPDGREVEGPWYSVSYDMVLSSAGA